MLNGTEHNVDHAAAEQPLHGAVFDRDAARIIDAENDAVRFYRLGSKWETKIETLGAEKGIVQDAPLLL